MSERRWIFPVLDYRVVDADTIYVTLDMGFGMRVSQYCRLRGIDAPEKHTAAGKAVTALVSKYLAAADTLECQSFDQGKYRQRFIGDVYRGEVGLASVLSSWGVVKPYSGAVKQTWTDNELSAVIEAAASINDLLFE